ncbi:MAG: urease accessory protein UreD [Actinomycetota bacterium]
MIATARLVASPGGRLSRIRCEPPLTLRPTPEAVYLVGSAAGPLGGDDLRIEVEVEEGADLTVRSSAASVALPGVYPSSVAVRARVGAGGALRWLVEPTVAARGCRHRLDADITLARGARLHWVEEIVLGRHGETSGSVTSRLSVEVGGVPLLRHELALGPDHRGGATPAVAGTARAVGTVVVVGGGAGPPSTAFAPGAALLALDGPGFQVVALASDRLTLRRLLDEGVRRGGWEDELVR